MTVGDQISTVGRTWWSKFTDEESMHMYTNDLIKFDCEDFVWLEKYLNIYKNNKVKKSNDVQKKIYGV